MRRLIVLVFAVLAAIAVAPNVLAQSPSRESPSPTPGSADLCISVTGPIPEYWTPVNLAEGIENGTIDLVFVGDADACSPAASAEPTEGPTEEPSTVPGERQGLITSESGWTSFPRGSAPSAVYAVLVRNPNADWVAVDVPVALAFIDKDGDVLTTESDFVTALPNQTVALADEEFDAQDVRSIEVTFGDDESDWQDVSGQSVGGLTFSGVRTRTSTYGGTTTTGRVHSTFSSEMSDVRIVAVYRNNAGKVIGGSFDYLDSVKPNTNQAFQVSGFESLRNIAKTEMYYEVSPN